MKKILLSIVMLAVSALSVFADGTLGVDYVWKSVTSSMTSVPDDFYEGVTAKQAEYAVDEYWANGAIYGNLPEAGGDFTYLDDDYNKKTKTWSQIVSAVEDWDYYYYPAALNPSSAIVPLAVAPQPKGVIKFFEKGKIVIRRNGVKYSKEGKLIK